MIPKHSEIWQPALELLGDGRTRTSAEIEEELAETFSLTTEERSQLYDSGNGPIFYDRINWALSYLKLAGLLDKPKEGVFRINDAGHEMLKTPGKLQDFIRSEIRERSRRRKEQRDSETVGLEAPEEKRASELTPQEELYESYENLRQSIYEDLLYTILNKSPRDFEHLVVTLLERMGYGGEVEEPGEVTRYTNDGGIDGVIKEDVLGLGRIHIQAKRYNQNRAVGREEIQKFVGALAVAQSNKAVFITTSRYSDGAREYAESLHGTTTVVLIDGQELAKFLYDYGVGLQVVQSIELKRLDSDYWDKMKGPSRA